ncbi:MAG: hypothetical protein A2854_03605 [Parcubacteria group bacterium RIFCSPHIGHO2_01_FULL_56_18]|nr:MAG: hypothetical protein A2854_03605 [Parcubacteria group bacterium RIFCSPHIGHO2_01_FULL_56_18]
MSDGDNGGEPNVAEEFPSYFPSLRIGPSIPHYYGDYVRQIFILTGAAMLVLAPFLVNRAPTLLPFEIGGAIALVCLAALTNPKKQWVLMADTLAAGVGVIVFESLSLAAYTSGNWLAFIALEAVAIAFLIALYFSLKTLRSMMLGQIGKEPSFDEFTDER